MTVSVQNEGVTLVGTQAELLNYPSTEIPIGYFYYAKDTGNFYVLSITGPTRTWDLIGGGGGGGSGGIAKYIVANQTALIVPGVTYPTLALAMAAANTDGTVDAPIYVTPGTYPEVPDAAFVLSAGRGREIIGMGQDPSAVQINFAGSGGGTFLDVTAGVKLGLKNVSITSTTNDSVVRVTNGSASLSTFQVKMSCTLGGNTVSTLNTTAVAQMQLLESTFENQSLAGRAASIIGANIVLTNNNFTTVPSATSLVLDAATVKMRGGEVVGKTVLAPGAAVITIDVSFSTIGGSTSAITLGDTSSIVFVMSGINYDAGQLAVQGPGPGLSAQVTIPGPGFVASPSGTTTVGPLDTTTNGLNVVTLCSVGGKQQQNLSPVTPGPTLDVAPTTQYARVDPGAPGPGPTVPAVQLQATAGLADGYELVVKNVSAVNYVRITPRGADTIDGAAFYDLGPKDSLRLYAQRSGVWDRTP